MQNSGIYRANQTFLQLTLCLFFVVSLLSGCSQYKPAAVITGNSILPVTDGANLPDVISSLLDTADAQYYKKNYSGSLATLERAIRINPRYAEIWSRMAQVYVKQGSMEQARQHAKRSNSVLKNNPQLKSFNNKIIESTSLTKREPLN